MAQIQGMVEEMNLEIGEKMKTDRVDKVEEVEEMKNIEVVEKIEEVAVEKAEERTMGVLEPICITMEEATTAGQGRAHEESARGLQASGSLL